MRAVLAKHTEQQRRLPSILTPLRAVWYGPAAVAFGIVRCRPIESGEPLVPDRRPNILWYCSDQQRFDTIGALGNPYVHTPNLDRLVVEGVAFTRAYCQSTICTPSRASFLTGKYASTVHVNTNGNSHFPPHERLITQRLAEAGYAYGLVGKLHLA